MGGEKSEATKRWRENTKIRMVQSMGGACCICGYNKCNDALELHHVDAMTKDFSFGNVMSNPKSWDKIKEELKKCILLCANHHREVHRGIVSIPEKYQCFDESLVTNKNCEIKRCSVCGKETNAIYKTCSHQCAAKLARKTKWDEINLFEELQTNQTYIAIGEKIGVSGVAVFKRTKKCYPELLGKRTAPIKRVCLQCGTPVKFRSKSGLCMNCYGLKRRKVERPTKEQLEEKLKTMSWCAIAREYGISDNGIRKWARSYGII